ncbi:acetyl ornithine aminotransferase family protein [Candidatus Amarolinea dominans]|uniref:acetyl ornithine aminotransferase family protein n=1 Tax=Candidatus Amarolinea dominans TaxID=3140696 RepID=UPI0031CC87E8
MTTQTQDSTTMAPAREYPHVLPGPQSAMFVARDHMALSPSYTRSYPFVIDHGRGAEVWDVDGNRFIDFNAGIAVNATGHCHPKVVEAIKAQADKFLHYSGTDFYYPVQIELAEKLTQLVPIAEPSLVFFTNSGAEAVEAALKLARYTTGRQRFLAFRGAFHGRTMGALSLTASKYVQRRGFAPLMPGVEHVDYGYCYRCPVNLTYPGCGIECVRRIETEVFRTNVPPQEVAAIFMEPVQGEGGYVVPPLEWMQALRALCDKYGILLVADEVQSGFGRTGKMFAMEHFGVEPDIICLAKGIASGLPLGAMVARKRLMTWPPGAHASTFGGNPLSCAAALATIQLIEDEFMENSRVQGEYLKARLQEMAGRHPTIGDVRGLGLMVGAELVNDKLTKERFGELRNELVDQCYFHGLLILGCGPNTIRFAPPLMIPRDLIDEGLIIFERVLSELEEVHELA